MFNGRLILRLLLDKDFFFCSAFGLSFFFSYEWRMEMSKFTGLLSVVLVYDA